jgi:hypothetical protein
MLEDVDQGLHTASQLAALHFSEVNETRAVKKCAARLQQLWKAGFVKRFPNPALDREGRPAYVYYPRERHLPRGYRAVAHGLAVTEFRVRFLTWLHSSPGFSGRFLYPAQIDPSLRLGLVPDGLFLIERNGKRLLYFLEVDLGTESLTGNTYALAGKLAPYAAYFDARHYVEDLHWLGRFKGFRVVFLFNAQQRLQNFQRVAAVEDADFVLLKVLHCLMPESFTHGWMAFDSRYVDLFGRGLTGELARGLSRVVSTQVEAQKTISISMLKERREEV